MNTITLENSQAMPRFYPPLATEIGLSESILLLQLQYWVSHEGETDPETGMVWLSKSADAMLRGGLGYLPKSTLCKQIKKLLRGFKHQEKRIHPLLVEKIDLDENGTPKPRPASEPRRLGIHWKNVKKLKSISVAVSRNETHEPSESGLCLNLRQFKDSILDSSIEESMPEASSGSPEKSSEGKKTPPAETVDNRWTFPKKDPAELTVRKNQLADVYVKYAHAARYETIGKAAGLIKQRVNALLGLMPDLTADDLEAFFQWYFKQRAEKGFKDAELRKPDLIFIEMQKWRNETGGEVLPTEPDEVEKHDGWTVKRQAYAALMAIDRADWGHVLKKDDSEIWQQIILNMGHPALEPFKATLEKEFSHG